jgi:hypothetical protein
LLSLFFSLVIGCCLATEGTVHGSVCLSIP